MTILYDYYEIKLIIILLLISSHSFPGERESERESERFFQHNQFGDNPIR